MIVDNIETLIKIHAARGELYAFLSRIFSNVPDNDMYHMVEEILPKLKVLGGDTDNEDIKTGTEGIAAFLEKRNSLSGKELEEFDLDRARHYTSLLCLQTSVPSDESIYTSPQRLERDKSYDQVLELFGKYKMKKVNIPENEDHISYELLFMSKLAYDCVEFIKEDKMDDYGIWLNAQYDFHTEHMDKWVFDFFKAIIDYGITDEIIYKYCSFLAYGFIKEDKLVLEELLA